MDVLNGIFAKLAKRRSSIHRRRRGGRGLPSMTGGEGEEEEEGRWIVKPDKSTRPLMLGNFPRRSRHSVEGGPVSIRFRDNHAAVRRELHRAGDQSFVNE